MNRDSIRSVSRPATGLLAAVLVGTALVGFVWPWDRDGPWPSGSTSPVEPLGFPTLEAHLRSTPALLDPIRFAVFGDQRALADGEWQELLAFVAEEDRREGLAFVLDTGDLVHNGKHSDQFAFLRELLDPVSHLPYLVCAGNHELCANRDPEGRRNLATLLQGVSPDLSPERFYFRQDIGPLRLLFLDSNDLVYGDDGEDKGRTSPLPGSRAEAQLAWLEDELAHDDRGPDALTVAVLHHPFVQSSDKHSATAAALWSYRYRERTLPALLLEGGVDLVLTGHTHSTERFRLRRDGRELRLVNLSGRPRDGFLWFGSGSRRTRDLAGREHAWLEEHGWHDLDGWKIEQEHAMTGDQANQCGLFTLDASGILWLEMVYLRDEGGVRRESAVRLH